MANFVFYNGPYSTGGVWRTASTGRIISYGNTLSVSSVNIGGGVVIKYTNSPILAMSGGVALTGIDPSGFIISSYDDIGSPTTFVRKYTAGELSFGVRASQISAASKFATIGTFIYAGVNIGLRNVGYSASGSSAVDGNVHMYTLEINGEAFIYFSAGYISDGNGLIGAGISMNAFEGAVEKRYPEYTIPDPTGGYGTGETPSGEQDGTPSSGTNGGDHISVYPPSVSVDVDVNMPETEKPATIQPHSGVHLALIDNTAFAALVDGLWGRAQTAWDDLWAPFKNYYYNPIEAIVSCFRLPKCFVDLVGTADHSASIAIAGTNIIGFEGLAISSPCIVHKTWTVDGITQFNSWEDFVGVTVRAYAPYIGWFELDPSLCFGVSSDATTCRIEFRYTCDCSNGNLSCEIWACSVGKNDTQTHEAPIAFGYGNCAYPLLIPSNDGAVGNSMRSIGTAVTGAIMTAASLGIGNIPGAVGGMATMAGGAMQNMMGQQHTTTVGTVNGSVGAIGYLIPFVEVIKPRYALPNSYNSVYGRPSYAGSTVSDFKGYYAELDVHCEQIGFANDWEQQKIIEMLARGVHV